MVDVNEEVDFSQFTHVTPEELEVTAAEKSGTYSFSIVNTAKNGVRATLSKTLHEALGSPKKLQFVADGDDLYIGATIPEATEYVPFSAGTGTHIIYNRGFVEFLTRRFNLDYSNRSSISFKNIKLKSQDVKGNQIVYAKIKMTIIDK